MSDLLSPGSQAAHPQRLIPGSALELASNEPVEHDVPINLLGVLSVLRRHVRLVLGLTALVTAVAGLIAYRSSPVYQAGAVIRVTDARDAMTAGLDNPVLSNTLGSQTDPVLSQIQVLESRGVAAQVIDSHPMGLRVLAVGFDASALSDVTVDSAVGTDSLEIEFAESGFTVHGRSGVVQGAYGTPVAADGISFVVAPAPSVSQGQLVVISAEIAINNLIRDLDAQPRKNTDVIDVSYKNTDRVIAQAVVDTVVTTFQRINASNAQEESRRRRLFVQEQLAETDSILEQAQLALSNFASTKQVYGTDQVIAAEQSGLMDLDAMRAQLNANRTMYRGLLDSLEKASGQGLADRLNEAVSVPDIAPVQPVVASGGQGVSDRLNTAVSSSGTAQDPVVLGLYQQLVAYETTRDSMTTGPWASAPGNPDVIRLNALISTTQRRLTGALRSQVDGMSARIAALDALNKATASQLQKLPAVQASEARLVQRVEAARKVSDQLREEYQKARIAEAVEAGQVEIVDLAPFPLFPITRGPLFKTLVGLLVGLLLGVGAAFLKENLNTAIQRRDEIESLLRVPGLAIIPQILPASGQMTLPGMSKALPGGNGNGSGRRDRAALIAATEGRSTGAEAFRTLRTSLIFSQAVQSLHTLVVTSASPEEGKTTTIANLAVTFAQQGLRVILVDCDLRRARLHSVFNVPREPGLTNAMLGQVPLEDAIRPTAIEGLSFLSSGALPPNPAELLGGGHMAEVLASLRAGFDMVLMDTPPVHAASDALILGRQADGVLMVVRAGKTDRSAAQDAMRSLANVGARVVGAVLNDPDHKVPAYGGYYYYDYYGSKNSPAEPANT